MAAEVQVQQQQQQQQDADYNSAPLSVQSAEGLEHCSLLGGAFAMFVQCALAAAAIGTLVYKRHSEKPQRPWRVWFFDASKQAYAGFLQHLVNIAFGMWFASSGAASECAWYAVNFAISVVCGVFLLWGAMRLYTRIVERFRLHYLRSGEYGNPPSWRPWLAQLLVWGFLASGEKVVTAVLVIVPLHPLLDSVALLIERPFLTSPRVEQRRPEALAFSSLPPARPASANPSAGSSAGRPRASVRLGRLVDRLWPGELTGPLVSTQAVPKAGARARHGGRAHPAQLALLLHHRQHHHAQAALF